MRVRISDSESVCGFGNESFCDLDDLIAEGYDDAEFMALVPKIRNGESVTFGGGWLPLYFIQPIQD